MRGPSSALEVGAAGAVGSWLVAVVVVLLIILSVRPADEGDEKTHDRFQPWVLVGNQFLASTSTDGVADYDDQQVYLSKMTNHGQDIKPGWPVRSSTDSTICVHLRPSAVKTLIRAVWL